jgi:ribonucleoside-diphosphate reductase alpha chain
MKLEFLKEEQVKFLREGQYIEEGETPQERFQAIVDRIKDYEKDYSDGLTDRMAYMLDKNIFSLSTPALANFGRKKKEGSNTQSLPASCNIITVGDSISDIGYSNSEVRMLSKLGAAAGTNYTRVSPKGTKISHDFYTNSKLDWIEDDVSAAQKTSQGAKRRGYVTPFISILDEDFYGLMSRIDKKNPDKNDRLINNTVGIILPAGFRDTLNTDQEAKRRYLMVLKERQKTGKVYMVDVDNCNINSSEVYKKLNMPVEASNICSEFVQPLFDDMTSVCVIGALNLNHWKEISENPQMIKDSFMFLDIMNEEYIKLTEGIPFMGRARKAAKNKRDIGLGVLGFHEAIQKKGFAFGDIYSRKFNKDVFKTIREFGEVATREMAEKLGSAPICTDAGMIRRNASLMMVAPNKSTSFISGVTSGGIEPFMSNIFMKTLAKIQHVFRNPHLETLLKSKGMDTESVWDSIMDHNGSVSHLDSLSKSEKDVFKTFAEISPKDIIDLARDRQEFIDMGQSLNLVFRKNYTLQDIASIHKYAWDNQIKTLYYAYSSAHAALEKDGEDWDFCVSCSD